MYKIFGTADENTKRQMDICMSDPRALGGVLCADNHYGYAHPVGGVVAYSDCISLSGVGYDIGCGNFAVETDATLADVLANINTIMDDVASQIEFGVASAGGKFMDNEVFNHWAWDLLPEDLKVNAKGRVLKDLARVQLGSVGGGNHYVDIFQSDDGRVWVGCHFGSRGFGHTVASYFMRKLGAKDNMDSAPTILEAKVGVDCVGNDYVSAMKLAGEYADAGRRAVIGHIVKNILKANVVSEVSNHHNFAWREEFNGEMAWVVRKGSTPNYPGQMSFVGGSMGDYSYILEGVDTPENKAALYSTIHGAGRTMSRNNAKKLYTREQQSEWVNKFGVCVRGGDVDESPMAYKRIEEVLGYHSNTVKILHGLKPIGVAMASPKVIDPYKD